MAGRGAHLTRPAWMTRDSKPVVPGSKGAPNSSNGFDGARAPLRPGAAELKDLLQRAKSGSSHTLDIGRGRSRSRSPSDSSRGSSRSGHRARKRDRKEKKEKKKKDRKRRKRSRSRSWSNESSRRYSKRERRDRSPPQDHKSYSASGGSYPLPARPSKLRVPSMWDKRPEDIPGFKNLRSAFPSHASGRPGTLIPNFKETRHARRLYIGGIGSATIPEITDFFNHTLSIGLGRAQDPHPNFVQSVYVQPQKNYAFVEFQSVELACGVMTLDGLDYQGVALRINRPNDYRPEAVPSLSNPVPTFDLSKLNVHQPQMRGNGGPKGAEDHQNGPSQIIVDGPEKLFVGGLPHHLKDDEVTELLEAFGKLKALKVIREDAERSKGYGFCQYLDPAVTDKAIAGLNDLQIGTRRLTVRRSNPAGGPAGPPSISPPTHSSGQRSPTMPKMDKPPTSVLVLLNMVTKEELADDTEYAEIKEDIESEVSKYGKVCAIEIPRPDETKAVPGLEKIFIRFVSALEATAARFKLEGRTFAGNKVQCDFIDVADFENQRF